MSGASSSAFSLMAWTTKKTINLRSTVAFATDNAGEICLPGDTSVNSDNPPYTGAGSSSPLTLDGDSFNAGWTSADDGARNRSANRPSSSDHRLAGKQGGADHSLTFQLQAGTAPGSYRIWAAFTDQTNGTSAAPVFSLTDANGTLLSSGTLAALASNAVYDINGRSTRHPRIGRRRPMAVG